MFDHCLYFNTTSLARLLERAWSAAFAPFGLTPPQGFLLRVVLKRPGLSQRELAEIMTIARPTATRILDGLVGRGLVERRTGEADAREQHIHPTCAAEQIAGALDAASADVTRRLKQALGKQVFDQAVGQLRGIRAAIG
ncbi:MarR family winged helix-turn-helix transcriptional regulator [Sorangium cellulosum]|uniref:MarR family transcriptional regulator n=1 Tax=Sorangium cellulosum TaxID=56 RepID=A0A150QQT9_SORCE|nr:MarR family transcriptional regulator [Sorangium cellulosum]KYF70375.1 MarR family transcriptional regulator [Sorangium cellulosum]